MVSSETLNSSVAAILTRKKILTKKKILTGMTRLGGGYLAIYISSYIDQDNQAGWRSHLADTGTLGVQREPILPDVWNQLPCHMDTMHTTAHNMGTLTIPVQV